jgi:intracellular sulfur oxidation DsrE/DsrF family protein
MSNTPEFSDERLNAFVDGELDAHEREEILAAMACDTGLGHRLCELRAMKDLVRHAYDQVPAPRKPRRPRMTTWGGLLAACLVLAVGVLLGWQGHRLAAGGEAEPPTGWLQALLLPQPGRILIHLDTSDEQRMEEALDMAEAYLLKAGRARVEVVVNNSGLDLLREQATPYALRIAELSARHEMLAFVACGNAIARYRANGRDVSLVPEARVAKTAVEHIVDRVRQGWTYVKI